MNKENKFLKILKKSSAKENKKKYLKPGIVFVFLSLISIFLICSAGCSRTSAPDGQQQQSSLLDEITEISGQTTPQTESSTTTIDIISEQENNYDYLKEQFENLESQNEPPYKLIELLDEKYDAVGTIQLGKLFEELELYMSESMDRYTGILLSDYEKYQIPLLNQFGGNININDIENIEDSELRNLVEEIYKSGLKLVGLEGNFYPIIDYQIFLKYTDYMPAEDKEYIFIQAKESEKLSMADAALTITWDDIAQRLVSIENFVTSFPDSSKKEAMGNLFFRYLTSYFYGLDNTPAFDYNSNEFYPDVIESYKKTISDHSGTVVSELVSTYLAVVENNNLIMDDNIRNTAEDLVKQAEQKLNITNPFNF